MSLCACIIYIIFYNIVQFKSSTFPRNRGNIMVVSIIIVIRNPCENWYFRNRAYDVTRRIIIVIGTHTRTHTFDVYPTNTRLKYIRDIAIAFYEWSVCVSHDTIRYDNSITITQILPPPPRCILYHVHTYSEWGVRFYIALLRR